MIKYNRNHNDFKTKRSESNCIEKFLKDLGLMSSTFKVVDFEGDRNFADKRIMFSNGKTATVECKEFSKSMIKNFGNDVVMIDLLSCFYFKNKDSRNRFKNSNGHTKEDFDDFIKNISIKKKGTLYKSKADYWLFSKSDNGSNIEIIGMYDFRKMKNKLIEMAENNFWVNSKKGTGNNDSYESAYFLCNLKDIEKYKINSYGQLY